jgi:hypothetical protein
MDTERFVDNMDGTILDKSTGLTWQKDTPDLLLTLEDAEEYAKTLELSGNGWRIPTRDELLNIVEHGKKDPCLNDLFGAVPIGYYLSSTLSSKPKMHAWCVSSYSGFHADFNATFIARVRCVR